MAQPLGALWKRGLPQFPAPMGGLQLPATPSNSRRCNPLFWPPLPLAHVWHTPKQTHTNINKIIIISENFFFKKIEEFGVATETLGSNFQSADPGVDWENTTDTLTSGLTAHLTGESLKETPNPAFPHLTISL